MTLIFQDNFDNRTLTNDLGVPSGPGHYLEDLAGEFNRGFSITGGTIQVPGSPDDQYHDVEFYMGPSSPDVTVQYDFFTSTGAYYFYVAFPHKIATLWYQEEVEVYDSGTDAWQVTTPGGGNVPLTLTADTWYTIKAEIDTTVAQHIKIRVWERGTTEPSTWDVDAAQVGTATANPDFHDSNMYIGWWTDANSATPSQVDNLQVSALRSDRIDFFTADAVIDDGAVVGSFTGNSYLVETVPGTFTADAFFRTIPERSFTADAVLFKSPTIGGLLAKRVSLTILQRREKPLDTFIPPKIPDSRDLPEDPLGGPPCLPPCPGAGAGYGTGYGVNGGAIVLVATRCTSGSCAETYFNDGDNWLGRGPISTGTHCGCEISHSRTAHVNRMWITYSQIPEDQFRMRAKMIWDVGSPPNVTVNIYANATAPVLAIGECGDISGAWDNGTLIGRMTFSADGNGTIGERSVWFQEVSSQLVIDPAAITTDTFRFELADESQYYRGEFKASSTQIVVD